MTQIASLNTLLANSSGGSAAGVADLPATAAFASVLSLAQGGGAPALAGMIEAAQPQPQPQPQPQAQAQAQAQAQPAASTSATGGSAASSQDAPSAQGAQQAGSTADASGGGSAANANAQVAGQNTPAQAGGAGSGTAPAQGQGSASQGQGGASVAQGPSSSKAQQRGTHDAKAAQAQCGAAAQAAAQTVLAQWMALSGQGATPAGGGGKAGGTESGKTLPQQAGAARPGSELAALQLAQLAQAGDSGGESAVQALKASADAAQAQAGASASAPGHFPQLVGEALAVAGAAQSGAAALPAALTQLVSAGAGTPSTTSNVASQGAASQAAVPLATLAPAASLGTALPVAGAGAEPAATYSSALPSPVGSAPWGQELGQQMLLAIDGKLQSATLHLNPPQLGPLEVHLQMQAGQVNAQFASPHQAVREAVQSALPQLHDMFAGAGLNLSQASVGSGSPGREQAPGGRRGGARPGMQLAAEPVGALGQSQPAGWLRGLVNTYV